MMDDNEKELREILETIVVKPPDFNSFVLQLLDIKAWHQADRSHTRQALGTDLEPLTEGSAQDAVLSLCKILATAEKSFRRLNVGTVPSLNAPEAQINCTVSTIGISRVINGEITPIEGGNIAIDLAPEILKWLKDETEKAALQLVKGQKRPKQVKEFDLWMLGGVCQQAGITCSSSEGTPFHRLASWLLGEGDHKRIIKKIMGQYPYLKDKKDKISKT